MNLSGIYQPIQEELRLVEDRMTAIAEVDSPYLAELLSYVVKSRGKRLRPALVLLCGKVYDHRSEFLVPTAAAVELLHTATLVHDDTVDHASIRRGKTTVNSRWDGNTAILAGDYLFACSADLLCSTGNMRLMQLFADTIRTISGGELRHNLTSLSRGQAREGYFQWVTSKTAALLGASAEAGALLSSAPEEKVLALRDYGLKLGTAFQIVDDVLDFTGQEETVGKPVGQDLLQGAFTLPFILFLESYPHKDALKRLWLEGNAQDLLPLLEEVRTSPFIGECYRIAGGLCAQAREALTGLPQGPCLDSLVALTDFVLQRDS